MPIHKRDITLLLVDDDRLSLDMMRLILSPLSHRILMASNGADALELLKANPDVSLILLDLQMPVMDGFETLEQVRKLTPSRHIPVIVVTSDQEKLAACFRLGAADFISKPYNPDEIKMRVTTILNNCWAKESAKRAKDEFLANISHEVRTPMNGILGMLQLLEMTELSDVQKDYVEQLETSSNRLLELLNNLINISRLETERLTVTQTSFDLRRCISDVLDLVALKTNDKNLTTSADIASDIPPQISADHIHLIQVLANVVGNAVKFTERGGVTIKARLVNGADAVTSVCIDVSDTGIGIPPEWLETIFEEFTQQESSYTRRYEGAGLGLSVSRKLITLMGGSIMAESTVGQGTTIHLSFPAIIPEEYRATAR